MRECLALSLFLLISGCKLSSQTQTSSSGNTQPQAPAVSLKSGELTNSAVAGYLASGKDLASPEWSLNSAPLTITPDLFTGPYVQN